MEKPPADPLDVHERLTDPYALATILFFSACTLNFGAAALDALGMISVWSPDPEPLLLVLLGTAFVLQSAAAVCAVRFYRTGIARIRNIGGLISLATLAVLTLSLLETP